MTDALIEKVKKRYEQQFSNEPMMVRAPGRINLIGEHTDYNMGFVLPAAVDYSIVFAMGIAADEESSHVISLDMGEETEFSHNHIQPLEDGGWKNFVLGVIFGLQEKVGRIPGANIVFSGNVPRGSGMSSSAALSCGVCFGLSRLFDLKLEPWDIIKIAQKAEHNFVGVKCGIMDQFASVMGKASQAMLLDCRNLQFDYFPMHFEGYSLLLCNSNVSHNLASSAYNERREQCEMGVAILRKIYPKINSLRDVTMEQLEMHRNALPGKVYDRCAYIVKENKRVVAFSAALQQGAIHTLGAILKEAQAGMEQEYEITCPEIDFLASVANNHRDVAGARMMGGGFGGCTLNLVKNEAVPTFIEELGSLYEAKFGLKMTPIQIQPSEGVSIIE